MGDVYLTGRERTVTWSGTTDGDAYRNWGLYEDISPVVAQSKVPFAQMLVFGVTITWESNILTGSGSDYVDIGERVRVYLPHNWGTDTQQNIRRFYKPNPYTGNIDGTWQVQATLQECVEVIETAPGSGDDAPPYLSLRFFERLKPGSTLSASATCNGVTASASVVVPAGTTYEVVAALLRPVAQVTMINEGDIPYAGDCTVTYSSAQTSVGNPNFSQTLTQGGVTKTISVTNTQAYAYASVTDVPPPTGDTVVMNAQLWGTKDGSVNLKVFSVDSAYPESLVASVREKKNAWTDVNLSSGAGSLSIAQRKWSIATVLYGNPGDYSIDEYDTVKAQLKTTSLQAVGEDQHATRLFGHGWIYEALSLSHSTRLVLDSCDVLINTQREWVAVQQCNLSASGGIITITATGSNPIVRRTRLTPSYERWNSYAFLRLRVRASVADAPFTVVVGSKRYNARTGVAANTWTDVYIDLCAPSNSTASYDQQTTVYPDDRPDGDYWGITKASEMRLELAQATWDIDEVSLDVQPWSLRTPPYNVPNHSVHVMPSRAWWIDTGRGYEVRRFITGQSDGKLALELEDVRRTQTTVIVRTIQQLAQQIGESDSNGVAYWPGWTGVLLANTPDPPPSWPADLWSDYLNAYRPASYLCGSGAIFNGSQWLSKAGRNQLDTSFDAQILFDEIDWYTGAGDAWQWGTGAYGTPLVLAFGAVLRALAFGLVLSSQKARFANGGVRLERSSDGQDGGSASLSGWQGYYETGSPYAKGLTEYRLVGTGDASNAVLSSRTYFTRLPLRTVTTLVLAPQWRALEADWPRSYLHVASNARMDVYFQADGAWLLGDENWDNLQPQLVRIDRRWDMLYAIYADGTTGGTLKVIRSANRLEKWQEVLTLTARSGVLETISARGIIVLLWENSGNVQVQYSYDGGTTWTAAQNALLDGSPFTGELLDSDYDPGWDAIYLIRKSGSSVTVLKSYDLGANFTTMIA